MALVCILGFASSVLNLACPFTCQAGERIPIDQGWEFRQAGQPSWKPASVPGCVHTDLLEQEIIEDPFYRLNEKSQQWIGQSDWEYRTSFEVQKDLLENDSLQLVFHGLDTYADVYLNGSLVLSTDNMFRTWKLDCKEHLHAGKNHLRVFFHNVFKVNLPKYEAAPFELKAFRNNDQAKIKLNMYSRKAGFHYGWDWGPRLITCGVWRPVELHAWDHAELEDVFFVQEEVSARVANITARIQVNSTTAQEAELTISSDDTLLATRKASLDEGSKMVNVEFEIKDPELWWTNGLGEHHLYELKTELKLGGEKVAEKITSIGIRELEVVREPDDAGKSMYVKLNGVPIFIKGANYIPQDSFQSRVTTEKYEYIVQAAGDANMNMLRVWGGGIYEEDLFYDLCDQNGILVWQDIMFACAMYPADEEFLANVRQEVIDNASRLRNHPSLAMYCGNNEVEISWHEWGWKELFSEAEQQAYDHGLRKLFYTTIPEALNEVDPTRYYHPTSPGTGYLGKPYAEGDAHYWGVWHGKEPFEEYENKVARFMSEYGFQSYPELSTVEKYTLPEDRFLESDVMHSHQRSMADEGKDIDYGNRLINHYLDLYFRKPKDFESHLYATQLLQAFGVQWAIEAHRRNMPHCMGTLYWQINDCWPVASWSSIDYFGRWKALHYAVKRAYEDVLISTVQKGEQVEIHLVSDKQHNLTNAVLELQALDFTGKELWQGDWKVDLERNSSAMVGTIELGRTIDSDPKSTVLVLELKHDGRTIANQIHKFVYPRDLKLRKPDISKTVRRTDDGYEIVLKTSCFASHVCLGTSDAAGLLSENFFDMVPGREYRVQLGTNSEYSDPDRAIWVKTLYDSYSSNAKAIQAAQVDKLRDSVPH